MWALFARRDHPPGWGQARVGSQASAHGYVVIAVWCTNEELGEVVYLLNHGFYGFKDEGTISKANLGDWFGGQFDLIGTIMGIDHARGSSGEVMSPNEKTVKMYGDNRMFGTFLGKEIINRRDEIIEYGNQVLEWRIRTKNRSH